MKDISSVNSDGHTIFLYDSDGNSIGTPLNLDSCVKDIRYDGTSLIIIYSDGQITRICTDMLVDDCINNRLNKSWSYTPGQDNYHGNPTNEVLARITAKILGNFLGTPDGVRAIKKELDNYFNGTS